MFYHPHPLFIVLVDGFVQSRQFDLDAILEFTGRGINDCVDRNYLVVGIVACPGGSHLDWSLQQDIVGIGRVTCFKQVLVLVILALLILNLYILIGCLDYPGGHGSAIVLAGLSQVILSE